MKRILLALTLVFASSVLANVLYTAVRPAKSEEACSMDWLARELELSPAQYDAIYALHTRQCPRICQLSSAAAHCDASEATRLEADCRAATTKLIADVSTHLSSEQRGKYLQLVAPCLRGERAASQ